VALTIKLSGLCSLEKTSNGGTQGYRAVMVPGHGEHRPVMTLTILEGENPLDLSKTTWLPDYVNFVEVPDGMGGTALVQTAVWQLQGVAASTTGLGKVELTNPASVFDFVNKGQHKNPSRRSLDTIIKTFPATSIFQITEGTLTGIDTAKFNILRKDGSEVAKDVSLAQTLSLVTSNLVIERDAHHQIVFQNDPATGKEPLVHVTNFAPIRSTTGVSHFHHYYDIVEIASGEQKLHLINSHPPFFDCVPPTEGP
jgi:hypothetical protein